MATNESVIFVHAGLMRPSVVEFEDPMKDTSTFFHGESERRMKGSKALGLLVDENEEEGTTPQQPQCLSSEHQVMRRDFYFFIVRRLTSLGCLALEPELNLFPPQCLLTVVFAVQFSHIDIEHCFLNLVDET